MLDSKDRAPEDWERVRRLIASERAGEVLAEAASGTLTPPPGLA